MSVLLNLPPIPSSYKLISSFFLLACILHVSIQFHFSRKLAGWLEVTLQRRAANGNEAARVIWISERETAHFIPFLFCHSKRLIYSLPYYSTVLLMSFINWGAGSHFCQALSTGLGRKVVCWSVRPKLSCTSKLVFSGAMERTSPSTW